MEPIFLNPSVEGDHKQICLIDLPRPLVAEPLTDFPLDRHQDRLTRTDLVILRPAVDTSLSDPQEYKSLLTSLIRRTPKASGHVLHSLDFSHSLSPALVGGHQEDLPAHVLDSMIKGIREAELKHYMEKSDALFAERDGFVYRAPSGHHVRRFLRVGNIQRSRQAIDSVFFWMLPFLKDCQSIIVDTWSIGSIAINAAWLLEKYLRSTNQGSKDCGVDLLPTYFDGSLDSRIATESILRRAWVRDGSLLVLFSAVRSGGSLARVREALSDAPKDRVQYLSLYCLGVSTSVPSLCTGLEGFETVEKQGTVITIDPTSYFPVTAKDELLRIRKADAAPNFPSLNTTEAWSR